MHARTLLFSSLALILACGDDRAPSALTALTPDLTGTPQAVLVTAGDIASCSRTYDAASAALVDGVAGAVVVLGDAVAPSASSDDYARCYQPTWGRYKSRTYPVPGELDYETPGAAGYFGYFDAQLQPEGAQARDSARGYYSTDVGDWHIVMLNSNQPMTAGSAQEQWLKADLAAHPATCTLAAWHYPRFFSGWTTDRTWQQPIWDDLYAAGAEIVLNAHTRNYERFAPQNPDANPDPVYGLREFVVGTGGLGFWGFSSPIAPNSEVRASPLGVLKLTLYAGGYDWTFLSSPAGDFSDSGSGVCHGPPGTAPVNTAPSVDAGPNLHARPGESLALTFRLTDADGRGPWSYTITWGDGATAAGTAAATGPFITASHVFESAGSYPVRVSARDPDGATGFDTLVVTADEPGSAVVFVGAGDVGTCAKTYDEATARLLDGIPGTVFVLGDNAYPNGADSVYATCFDASWGRHKKRIRPIPGNHDYQQPGASGYFDYFGVAAGDRAKGYYSYDIGSWHIVALNSAIATNADSPQEQWLRADLAAHPAQCTLAYWHHPRFSSGTTHGSSIAVRPLWQTLYDYGGDVVLSGHEHNYERFAPQTADGMLDTTRGIREFVAGTGGSGAYQLGTPLPNSETGTWQHGVLKLTLGDGWYGWEFVPVRGMSYSDAGRATCH